MSETPVRSGNPQRSLASRANLEHLRNEAKERLRAMRKTKPETPLSTAQLLVARSYGFPRCAS
jgi:hypothetical protein